MILFCIECKESAYDGKTDNVTSTLHSGEQSSISNNSDIQNTTSGIALEDDVFDNQDVTQNASSNNTVSDNSESSNQNVADNSSQEEVFEGLPEFDEEVELPMDKFD